MVDKHLNNQNKYQKLDKNLEPTILKIFRKLNKNKNIFMDKEFKYLNEAN